MIIKKPKFMDIFKANKDVMKKEHIIRKEYSYNQSGTTLGFSLRQDVKKEMQNFIKCLEEAMQEVQADLDNIQAEDK